jgi:hypothetical protein
LPSISFPWLNILSMQMNELFSQFRMQKQQTRPHRFVGLGPLSTRPARVGTPQSIAKSELVPTTTITIPTLEPASGIPTEEKLQQLISFSHRLQGFVAKLQAAPDILVCRCEKINKWIEENKSKFIEDAGSYNKWWHAESLCARLFHALSSTEDTTTAVNEEIAFAIAYLIERCTRSRVVVPRVRFDGPLPANSDLFLYRVGAADAASAASMPDKLLMSVFSDHPDTVETMFLPALCPCSKAWFEKSAHAGARLVKLKQEGAPSLVLDLANNIQCTIASDFETIGAGSFARVFRFVLHPALDTLMSLTSTFYLAERL